MTITFTVLGDPKAQKRHRMARRRGFIAQIDDSAEAKRDFLLTVQRYAPSEPFIRPVKLSIAFWFARPKGHYGKHGVKPSAPEWHHIRPDLDNLSKFVMDALNGVYWRDDSQVYELHVKKMYSDSPKTVVVIEPV